MIENQTIDNRAPQAGAHPVRRVFAIISRVFQVLYIVVAWLFALSIVAQTYLAGMGLFAGATWLEVHGNIGWLLARFSILMLVFLLPARFPWKVVGLHALLIADVIFQVSLVSYFQAYKNPALTALHPANALLLFIIATVLAFSALKWTCTTFSKRST
ncbi:hypothetical protein KSC_103980 [Ktedonobacter sp. SOSP1-52]|uniref:DUF6220 domain-containing protein n=1 Tax=Ktedonobacter sp. SOSP1-52 TaxID=2778366 RepID=UPI001916C7D2|nr:DUF6220 domain-containing protein [Ktedonobacter sp. SOSP1-52]GHO71506.1 hypothetical protein KSC_103980 [Ktedonobacter sp. SOSP1-52]